MKMTSSEDYRRAICIDPLLFSKSSESLDLSKLLEPLIKEKESEARFSRMGIDDVKQHAIHHTDKVIANLPEMMQNSQFYFGAKLMKKWLTPTNPANPEVKQEPTIVKWKELIKMKGMEDIGEAADEIKASVKALNGQAVDDNLSVGDVTSDSKADVKTLLRIYKRKYLTKETGKRNDNILQEVYVHGRTFKYPWTRLLFARFVDQDASLGSFTVKTHLFGKFGEYNKELKYRKFIVSKYTLSIDDGYVFGNDLQLLGAWSLPKKKFSLTGTYLTNKPFREFRRRWGIGKDFDVLVPPEHFILSKPIELRIHSEEK